MGIGIPLPGCPGIGGYGFFDPLLCMAGFTSFRLRALDAAGSDPQVERLLRDSEQARSPDDVAPGRLEREGHVLVDHRTLVARGCWRVAAHSSISSRPGSW